MQGTSGLLLVLILVLVVTSCGSIDGEEVSLPAECRAGEVPVDPTPAPRVFMVCGDPYVDPMYPVPVDWVADDPDAEQVLQAVVRGTPDRARELGLWTGFDLIPARERQSIDTEVEVSESGVATIRLTMSRGEHWQPPADLVSGSLADWAMFVDVLAATALSFEEVSAVELSLCPSPPGTAPGMPGECDPLQQRDLLVRHPSSWDVPQWCDLIDYWTRPECDPR